ncbi:MAG: pilin [bacterium]|nr:pilin [bacterium]MDA1024347.1 pilin [bacterium]
MTRSLITFAVSALVGTLIALPFFAITQFAHAQGTVDDGGGSLQVEDLLSPEFQSSTGLGNQDFETTIGGIISVVLGLLGIVAVVIVLIGGFKYMTAGGNTTKTDDAKKLLIAGVIGLAIILSAYAITSFVLSSLLNASS